MKKFNELGYDEQKEVTALFANWLQKYTHEVIVRVMEISEEIINNEFAMHLLKELKEREEQEAKDFTNSIGFLCSCFEDFKDYDPHNHASSHAQSYRDVLYDMYIKSTRKGA